MIQFWVPLIHDLISWEGITEKIVKRKVEEVLAFVLSSDYQEHIKPGFGTVKSAPRRYYAMGWSVHVPGGIGCRDMALSVRLVEFLAPFRSGYGSEWL